MLIFILLTQINMTPNPVEQSVPVPPLVVGVLSEGDVHDLNKWAAEQQITTSHLSGMGQLALRHASKSNPTHDPNNLYGVYFPQGAESTQDGRFIMLTGEDVGTQLRNDPDTYARFGLPEGGPSAAVAAMGPVELQGGLIRIFQPYEGHVKVRRNNDEIDDGWEVLALTKDGSRATVVKQPEGQKSLIKSIPIEDINPAPKIEKPALPDSETVARERQERQRQWHDRMFRLPTAEDMQDPNVRKRMQVTEKSVEDAVIAYRYSNSEVKKIFEKYKTSELWRESDMPQLARTNDDLRVELGMYLLNKLETTHYGGSMPSRIFDRHGKHGNHYGYNYLDRTFTSPEWVSLMALSMLDGTYKTADAKHDKIEILDSGYWKDVVAGQHRYAAYILLETPRYVYQSQITERKKSDSGE